MILGLTALSALAVATQALDSVRPPERLVRSYEVECRGRVGMVVIEERQVRGRPDLNVTLRRVTPLGATAPVRLGPELEAVFAGMASIQRVDWSCRRQHALLLIQYVDARTLPRGYERPITSLRVFLYLDENGLAREPQPAQPGAPPPAR